MQELKSKVENWKLIMRKIFPPCTISCETHCCSGVRIRNSEAFGVRCGYGNCSGFYTVSTKCSRRDIGLTLWSLALSPSEMSTKSCCWGDIQAWMDQSSDSAPQGGAHLAMASLLCFCGIVTRVFFFKTFSLKNSNLTSHIPKYILRTRFLGF